MSNLTLHTHDGQPVCAVVFDADGAVEDLCLNWETAQNMALNGSRVLAVGSDGHMSARDIQALCDAERARYLDCFGAKSRV